MSVPLLQKNAVQCETVTCRIGRRVVLDHISLVISRGEITGLLGPNGAGKTTLLSALVGLRDISAGQITVLGERLPSHTAALRRRIGVVFQETALYEELTVQENLEFAAALYALPQKKHRLGEVLDLLGLESRAREQVRTLSGGLRRRVTIARALLHSPELLIIDEPTLGVDVEARHAIWAHLRLLRAGGITIVVSTNYLDEATALCDTVAVLRAGTLLIHETPAALTERAGCCLDIECDLPATEALETALQGSGEVLRFQRTPAGASVFLRGSTVPEKVIARVLERVSIRGFRVRGADMAEVFQALEAWPV
jgi:ABC-2 type transport system ATP-binding protein